LQSSHLQGSHWQAAVLPSVWTSSEDATPSALHPMTTARTRHTIRMSNLLFMIELLMQFRPYVFPFHFPRNSDDRAGPSSIAGKPIQSLSRDFRRRGCRLNVRSIHGPVECSDGVKGIHRHRPFRRDGDLLIHRIEARANRLAGAGTSVGMIFGGRAGRTRKAWGLGVLGTVPLAAGVI
jgi:hypothetical protein